MPALREGALSSHFLDTTLALSAPIQVHVFEFVIEGKAHGQKNAGRGYRLSLPATENSFSGISALRHAKLR